MLTPNFLKTCVFVVLFTALLGNVAAATDYVFETVWIDERRSQRNPIEDCLNGDECSAVLTVAAAYVGIPPEAIQAARAVSKLTTRKSGESSSYIFNPPRGYSFCRVNVQTNSTVPANGRRASEMTIGIFPHEVGIMTITPRLSSGGSSWTGWFTFTYVRDGVNHGGRCKTGPKRIVFKCKGAAGHGGNCGKHRF